MAESSARTAGGFRLRILVLFLVAVALALVYRGNFEAGMVQRYIDDAGVWAPVLFMLVYLVATVLFLPGAAFTLLGGALFGPVLGTFCSLTGATLGAALAFLVSRYLASGRVEQRLGGRARELVDGVEHEGWRFIAFVRLVPLLPFNLLNYALGLTRIKFWTYVFTSYLFMFPGALAYTWLGYAGKEALAGGEGLVYKGLVALALLAAVSLLPEFIRHLRKDRD